MSKVKPVGVVGLGRMGTPLAIRLGSMRNDIYIWDVAAGLAIISEAGGMYLKEPGSSIFKFNVIASNRFLIDKLHC